MRKKMQSRIVVVRIFFLSLRESDTDDSSINFSKHRIYHKLMSIMKGLKTSDIESSFHNYAILAKYSVASGASCFLREIRFHKSVSLSCTSTQKIFSSVALSSSVTIVVLFSARISTIESIIKSRFCSALSSLSHSRISDFLPNTYAGLVVSKLPIPHLFPLSSNIL